MNNFVIMNDDNQLAWSSMGRCFVSALTGQFKIFRSRADAERAANRLRRQGRSVTVKAWVSPAGPMPAIFDLSRRA